MRLVRLCAFVVCLLPLLARAQVIVINEFMYDTFSHGTNEEWIELHNPTTNAVNLAGWRISQGVDFVFPNVTLAAGGYLVIAADPEWFSNAHPTVPSVLGPWSGSLANNGETIQIEDAAGNNIDQVTYADQGVWGLRIRGPVSANHRGWDWSTPHSGTGKSAELRNWRLTNNNGQNWGASTVEGGTPGAPNSIRVTGGRALILDAQHSPLVPRSTDPIAITARIADPYGVALFAFLHYRIDANPQPNPFTAVTMRDDGASGDGAAGDGVYGAVLPPRPHGTVIEFYIETVAANEETNHWPALASIDGVLSHAANALLQVDDSTYGGSQPIYRLIMTEAERAELAGINNSGDRGSDAMMNTTFVTLDGTGSQVRYLGGLRIRGAGSRGRNPPNYRLNLPRDREWQGIHQLNLNTQYTHAQTAGYALAQRAGLNAEATVPVQVRVNAVNLAGANSPQFGSYVALEVPNSDYVQNHFPDDDRGNLYRASTGAHSATLNHLGSNFLSYVNAGYSKQNNSTENDWSDLIALTYALSPNTPDSQYPAAVRQHVNVEAWMLYFAIFALLESEETSLGTGRGDDYAMYRGLRDPRFYLLAHDLDTVLGQGDTAGVVNRTIFRAADVTAIRRFLLHPEFVPVYYATLQRLLDGPFSDEQVARTLDDALGSWVPAATITAMKTFSTNRNAFVRSQIPLALTVQAQLPLSGGYPQTTSPTVALHGLANVINTRTILVNGATSTWSAWEGRWTNNNVFVRPGVNRVLVQALGTHGLETARTNIDIWFNVPGTAVSGTISSDTSWSLDNAPYIVNGALTIASGATLFIEPGVSIHFTSGASLTVANGGRILAEGTPYAPIRFTRVPGTSGTWAGIVINGAPGSIESRIAHAHFEFNNSTAIDVNGGAVVLDTLTFGTTDRRYLDLDGASFVVQDCHFPPTTAAIEPVHGTQGIRTGGHGIFVRNFFGAVNGYNDTLDFTGGNRPGPILHVIDNVFMGSGDDILDIDGTDAWVEGNIFLHVHRNGSPDSASGVSGGNDSGQTSEITIIGNLFYDVDHAATAKQGNFYTLINNTVVRQTRQGGVDPVAAVVNFADDGTTEGAGMHVEGNIFYDVEQLTRHLVSATVTFTNNLMPFTWTGPGGGNRTNDPLLRYVPRTNETYFTTWKDAQVMREWFTVRAGGPASGTGPNGRDLGGAIPIGASISGEPPGSTTANSATLRVGFHTANAPTVGWPNGSGYTHYRWRLNNGTWSAETPIATPIQLNGLTNGAYRVEVSGRRDTGLYQDDTRFGAAALVTPSRTWVATNRPGTVVLSEVLARNVRTLANGGEFPDLIELHNPGSTAVNLSGKGITDDATAPYKFVFPPGTTLAPGEYLMVYADDADTAPGLHLGFALNGNGDSVFLYEAAANGGALLDSVTFGLQLEDISIGKLADGAWALTQPTPGVANVRHPLGDLSALKINEWRADQSFGDDFVEIYNRGALPVDISGTFFSDAPAGSPMLHAVPALSFLPARGYFAFEADGNVEAGAEHLGFRLASEYGAIAFFTPGGALIDCVIYGPQTTDISEGLTPNGGPGRSFFNLPTPAAPNPVNDATIIISNTVVNVIGITNHLWRYESSNTDLGTAWLDSGYNDSAWPQGRGLFGFETSPALYPYPFNTPVAAPSQGGPLTVYYRTRFTWTNGAGWQLFATNYVDDGAVFYINGVEAARLRITASPVLFTSTAQTRQNEGQAEVITLSAANLVAGENILQVEVHQSDNGSSDDVFGMSLTAVRSITNIITTGVVLNELMANNQSFTNADGTITDWLEIFNPSGATADLSDMSLSDDVATPRRWVFPAGVTLAPQSYLVVKFDSSAPASTNAAGVLNTGFGFSSGGDSVLLFDKTSRGGGLVDGVQFGLQAADFTIGRVPNAHGAWALTLPTERGANIAAALGNPGALRINEWMANPRSGDDYFEIFNPNPQPVALGGLYLTDNLNNRTQYRIPNLSFIGTGVRGYVEFRADNNPQNGADHTNFRLSAGGESLGLFAANGQAAIDTVTFGAQAEGVSEGRFPDGSTNIVRFPRTPTPGLANYLPFTAVVINEALTHSDPPLEDAIELRNTTAEPVDISGWFLSDSQVEVKKFRIPEGTVLPPHGFVVFYENQFNPTDVFPSFSLSSAEGDQVFLSVADTNGALTGYRTSVDFGPQVNGVTFGQFETSIGFDFVATVNRTLGADAPASVEQFRTGRGASNATALVGPVVISEIQYHPPDVGTNNNTRDEFIELHNLSASAVPLYDPAHPTNTWRLRDAVDFEFAPGTSIPAGGYLLVVSFDAAVDAASLAAFRAFYGIGNEVAIVGPYRGQLSNGDEEIELRKPDAPNAGEVPYVLVERVHYRDSAPWPSAADGHPNGTGVSLQRRVAGNYANDPVNWLAGVPTPGGASGGSVLALPAMTLQPTNRTVTAGTSVTFVSSATGAAPLSYQWRFNGIDIPGATNANFNVPSAQFTNSGGYSVRVVNAAGAAVSATALLTLQAAPQIVFQPRSRNVAVGGTATFTVGARGTAPLRYQWWKDGTMLSGATDAALVIPNAQSPELGNYFVVVTNNFGAVTSAVATLELSMPPGITAQPANRTIIVGESVTFQVAATGSAPLFYQWRFNGLPISGANSSSLTFNNTQPSRAGTYSVIVSNAVGSIVSAEATLTVIVPPTVTVQATDPSASESGDPGQFTFTRVGSNNFDLTVSFTVSGSAVNGGDYAALPAQVVIPAGENSATLAVQPIEDSAMEPAETVRVTLASSQTYLIGVPGSATVTIADNDNLAPSVAVTSPTNGTFVPVTPTNLTLAAAASDPNAGHGSTLRVEFYFGSNFVGAAFAAPYGFTWTNPPAGSNGLVAVAVDELGLAATSAPVALTINGGPVVSMTSPTNGAAVSGPGNVFLAAAATDAQDAVAGVDFYVNGALLRSVASAPYAVTFSNAALGAYSTFAVARDTFGLSATSAVVHFDVVPSGTNFADLFANRGFITGFTNFKTGNNAGASKEAGEPNHWRFNAGGRSMWISWTAPGTGIVTVDLLGSSFDTLLGVYTNAPGVEPTVGNLIKVAENDDNGSALQSRVQFTNTVVGTVYHIAVDGYNGASGNFQMRLNLPVSPPTITAQPQSRTNDAGTTATFTVEVSSTAPVTYQWRFNNAVIAGATGATLTIPNVQPANEGNYRVVVANAAGPVASTTATLTVIGSTPAVPPLLVNARVTNGVFTAVLSGESTNRSYAIEVSTNLTSWAALTTVSNATGQVSFTDTNVPPVGTMRAYRARLLP